MEALSRQPLNSRNLQPPTSFWQGEEKFSGFSRILSSWCPIPSLTHVSRVISGPLPIFIGESFFRYDSPPSINGTLPLSRKAWARSMVSLFLRQFHGNFHRGPRPRTGLINLDRIENRFWITWCTVFGTKSRRLFFLFFARCSKSNYRDYFVLFISTVNKFDILTFYVTPISFFLIIFGAYYRLLKNVWSFR